MKGGHNIVCVGVGGMGMAPLALYLKAEGNSVWGYDDALPPRMRILLSRGRVALLDVPRLPRSCSEVIVSSAISSSHPLCVEARQAGIPIILRGEYLARQLKKKKLLAVVGSHGKTTTTSLLIAALKSAGVPFSYVLGGLFRSDVWVPAAFDASSDWVVVEVDESDGTIEYFSPEITVAVNFDWDHVAQYPTQEALEAAFKNLFKRTKSAVLIPSHDTLLAELASAAEVPVSTFGREGDFDAVFVREGFTQGSLQLEQPHRLPPLKLPTAGHHNAANALAALGGVALMGVALKEVSFSNYPGVSRRQDILWDHSDLCVVADYAHHPSELAALLATLKREEGSSLTVVFQPHRYTRTQHLASAFATVLTVASHVHLMPVYAASEPLLEAGMSEAILNAWPGDPSAITLWREDYFDALKETLLTQKSGMIAFVGAGDIEDFAQSFVCDLTADALSAALSDDSYFARDEALAKKTTLRVGGVAAYYAEPASEQDLLHLLRRAKSLNVPVFVLGRGSNVIISDHGFSGLVLRLNHACWRTLTHLPNGAILAGAGARLKEVCGFASGERAGGFEFLEGIPGTLGGALRMNAGAMGGWMFDVVESVRWVTFSGELKESKKEDLSISYRQCKELLDGVALSAVLKPQYEKDSEEIKHTMQAYARSRKETQPKEPSAGCIFKNADNAPAGRLIDELGLKGLSRGNAEVSLVHGNFIINKGGATSRDVLGLVREVHDRVRSVTGIVLEPEVLLLGESWEDILL